MLGQDPSLVSETTDAPLLIILCNFPQLTGLQFSPDLVRGLVATFPDRVRGAKDSSGDLAYAADLARIQGFSVFPSDEAGLAQIDVYTDDENINV